MPKAGDPTMIEGNKRRTGSKKYAVRVYYGDYPRRQARRTQLLGLVPRSRFRDRTENLEDLVKQNRNPDGNVSGAAYVPNVNIVQEPRRNEESIVGPAVLRGVKRLTIEGTSLGAGVLSAVGENMYIGCTPAEASTSSSSDATPRRFIPSVMEGADVVHLGPGTKAEQGALSAVGGNLIIGSESTSMGQGA
ncbi:hypothetical protein BT96DRAFT_990850 [Gymnopus androsaceus JB14]|uniref:Uncharacterized protein n=1 Tax=Gymnopus androsaceus JB14 TaxID=1447944 RepID=A0A6A4HX88_9AGAR|nr:hypothetical protein BT96DRAFT_990850 [Gymnopus androsaceus JB14]